MKRTVALFMAIIALLTCLNGCASPQKTSASFFLMDTVITVSLYTDEKTAEPILAGCRSILENLDRRWSRTNPESIISRFNESASGAVSADEGTLALVEKALEVSENTDGAFDIAVAPLVLLWQNCEKENRLPTDEEIAAACATLTSSEIGIGETSLSKNNADMQIDLGGIGKGAAISEVISYVRSCGDFSGIVSFGSNVAVLGKKTDGTDFRIALRDPKDSSAYVGTLILSDGEILSVSGDYERFYEIGGIRYHHILDPKTGYPSRSGLSSVAVVCDDGALADALSTALLVMGEEKAKRFYEAGIYDFEAVLIASDGKVSVTDGISLY